MLTCEAHWFDWSRDILHFITHFRDEIKPPIIGIGHSMGASVLVNLATIHTSLFTSLVLTEAMVRRVPSPPGGQSFFLMAYAAALRQEHWPSREEAERYLRGRKAYRTWDPRVVDLYVRHGLQNQAGQYPLEPSQAGQHHPSSNVTLKTSATQEALGIARPAYPPNHLPLSSFEPSRLRHLELATGLRRSELNAFYRPEALLSFRQLAPLTPSALFIYGEHATQRAEMQADVEAETGKGINGNGGIPAGAVKSVMISDSGHFVPFEKVASVAAEAGSWITDAVRRWKFDQDREIEEWYSRDARFKQQLPKDYMYWMHQQFGRKLKRDTPKTKEDGILEASAKL